MGITENDNNKKNPLSFERRINSFIYAIRGIKYLFKTQHNSSIQAIVSIFVIIFGFLFQISNLYWTWLILLIGLVFASELFNTAIENLTDIVSPEYNKKAGQVKDISAGGVLVCAIISVIIGLLIFLSKVMDLFH